jgi:type I restriction enzyme S subunit
MTSDWHEVELGDLIDVRHGFAFKGEHFVDEAKPHQLVTPGNFAIGGGFQVGKPKYYAGPVPSDYVLHPGDLVVTMTDLSRGADTLGYSAVVPKTRVTTWLHNQRIGLVRVKEPELLAPEFLHFLMRTDQYRHWVVSSASGSTVKHTSPGRICSYRFRLPPTHVQRAIGGSLTSLEDRIALLRETNATLESIAQALFKSWFVDFDPVRAKRQGLAPAGMDESTAALFPDGFAQSAVGPIPAGWRSGTLADFAELNSRSWSARNRPERIRYLDLANVRDNEVADIKELAFDEAPSRARRVLRDGDTIVGTVRPGNRSFAFIHEPPAGLTGSTGFAVLSSRSPESAAFIYLAATQDASIEHLAHIADGGAYPAVRPEAVSALACVVPPSELLRAFAAVARPLLQKVAVNLGQAQTLSTLRDTLLPRLISGQLRLPEAESALAA